MLFAEGQVLVTPATTSLLVVLSLYQTPYLGTLISPREDQPVFSTFPSGQTLTLWQSGLLLQLQPQSIVPGGATVRASVVQG